MVGEPHDNDACLNHAAEPNLSIGFSPQFSAETPGRSSLPLAHSSYDPSVRPALSRDEFSRNSSRLRLRHNSSRAELRHSAALGRNSSRQSLKKVSSRLGLRRRSISYPDMFEAEISDPLFKKSALLLNNNNTADMLDQMGDRLADHQEAEGLSLKIDALVTSKDKNLCQKIFSNWFFKRSEASSEQDGEEKPRAKKKSSLSEIVNKQFCAAKDFRHLNYAVPQSM